MDLLQLCGVWLASPPAVVSTVIPDIVFDLPYRPIGFAPERPTVFDLPNRPTGSDLVDR